MKYDTDWPRSEAFVDWARELCMEMPVIEGDVAHYFGSSLADLDVFMIVAANDLIRAVELLWRVGVGLGFTAERRPCALPAIKIYVLGERRPGDRPFPGDQPDDYHLVFDAGDLHDAFNAEARWETPLTKVWERWMLGELLGELKLRLGGHTRRMTVVDFTERTTELSA